MQTALASLDQHYHHRRAEFVSEDRIGDWRLKLYALARPEQGVREELIESTRALAAEALPPVDDEHLYRVMDALDAVAEETGKSVPQIAINWLLQRPTVSSVIIGARNEEQLRQNLGAVGWTLTPQQISKLDAASEVTAPYPYFPYRRQEGFARLNPPAV